MNSKKSSSSQEDKNPNKSSSGEKENSSSSQRIKKESSSSSQRVKKESSSSSQRIKKEEPSEKPKDNLKKTVKLKLPENNDPALQETVLILMHHQQALLEILIQQGVFTLAEFEAQVDREIARSMKL